ncbi:Acyl-CoA dehydrogenase, short-chain specific [Candidatus Zixiibacteriota bacterium]|nr:Acyl-CoA dehydrogenase, short-chain specific [candidate division Zixibacteria bacterium]
MDYGLSEDDLMIKETAREFARKRLVPNAMKYDEEDGIPGELVEELAELGYLGMMLPEEFGGLELSTVSFVGALEEICSACAGVGILISVQNSLCCEIIHKYASDFLKKKYLPQMATGMVGSYCITEPNAGTDVSGIMTSAVEKGDHYLINGTKTFVTNAGFAGIFIVFAVTDPSAGNKGISCFAIDKDTPGISIGAPENKCGMRASDTREVSFLDVKVPKENMIGAPGQGFKMALSILNSGRIGVSFQAIGIARAALEEAIKYAKERKQFKQPIANFQAIQFKLADMATEIEAGRILAYRAAALKDEGKPIVREASMAKLFCSRMANFVVNEAVQIHGGYGYMKEYPVERYFRDARVTELYEGTTEAQKMTIARDLLKE